MTKAEQELLEAVLIQGSAAVSNDPDYYSPLKDLVNAVLQERTPPEFEQSLYELANRFVVAQQAFWDYSKKHPLGRKMAGELLTRTRRARGIDT